MTLRAKNMETTEAYITFFNDLMLERRTALPAKITKINTSGGALVSVDVQVVIFSTITKPDGIRKENREIPIISGVPVVMPRSQTTGFALTIPIAVGDEVLLVFADRSIDNWQSTGKLASPAEPVVSRAHDLTDAIAIIGIGNDKTSIPNYSFGAIEMRNEDGTVSVSVSNSSVVINNKGIKITVQDDEIVMESGGSLIKIENQDILMENGLSSIKIESGEIIINSPEVKIQGDSFEMGSTSNTVTGGGLSNSDGLDFDSHVHIQSNNQPTGGPINP